GNALGPHSDSDIPSVEEGARPPCRTANGIVSRWDRSCSGWVLAWAKVPGRYFSSGFVLVRAQHGSAQRVFSVADLLGLPARDPVFQFIHPAPLFRSTPALAVGALATVPDVDGSGRNRFHSVCVSVRMGTDDSVLRRPHRD